MSDAFFRFDDGGALTRGRFAGDYATRSGSRLNADKNRNQLSGPNRREQTKISGMRE